MTILFILFTLFLAPVLPSPMAEGRFTILPESKVYLEGTSNVNKFKCDCGNTFKKQPYEIHQTVENKIEFSNTALQLPIEYFDCKNRKMDRDLQKALKADQFPTVGIELKQISFTDARFASSEESVWTHATAVVHITLAGVTQQYEIHVKAKKEPQFQFQFTGYKSMNMTDFEITPPEALFGMIKVNDQITFHFNLLLQIE